MPRSMTSQHPRMEAIEKTCMNSKKTHQNSQEVKVQTSQGIKKIQIWVGSSKRLCTCHTRYSKWHNNKWKDAIDLEIEQIKEYQVFKDYGKAVYEKDKIGHAPKGSQKIRVLLSLMSNTVENSKQDLWQMDILPRNLMKLSTPELFL